MSQFNINLEPPFPPETKPIVQFLQLHFSESPDARAHLPAAIENSGLLRQKLPDKAWVFHVSGALCCYAANMEAGRRFFGEALLIDPEYQDSRIALDAALAGDPQWPNAEIFLETLGQGPDTVVDMYMERARIAFSEGDLVEADRLCQRASAFNHPQYSMLGDLEACTDTARDLAARGELDGAITNRVESLHRFWQRDDHAFKEPANNDGEDEPLNQQLAAIVVEQMSASPERPVRVLEIGCLNGFNLEAARREAVHKDMADAWFGGLEPNAAAVQSGRRSFPDIEFLEGFHSDMIAGRVPVPERIDVCVVSLVFMVLSPADVAATLDFLSARTRTVVICDDVMNVEGDLTLIRGEQWLMHDFRTLLNGAGFEITDILLADLPRREGTGFIIAENRFPK